MVTSCEYEGLSVSIVRTFGMVSESNFLVLKIPEMFSLLKSECDKTSCTT